MKANLYVQGRYWASIDIPGDSLLAILADGIVSHAKALGRQLHEELDGVDQLNCSISLRFKEALSYDPKPAP